MRERRAGLAIVVALLMMLAWRHPSANIQILTHDRTDLAPHRVQAAVDLGVLAVNVLVTWTSHHLVSR